MTGHLHYVPILKAKRGEFVALRELSSRDGVTPLLEQVPSQPDDVIPRKMLDIWGAENAFFVDLGYVDDGDMPQSEAPNHPLTTCLAVAAEQHQRAIPVTGMWRSQAYQESVRSAAGSHGNGYAIRLGIDEFEEEEALAQWLEAFVGFAGVSRSHVDLIVDLGAIHGQSAGVVARTGRTLLEMLPGLTEWRTLTLASGGFPPGLASLNRGEWNEVPRNDWLGWRSLINSPGPISRLPAFGDYTIANTELPASGRATILAQLRYTVSTNFLIYKGEDVNRHRRGYSQFCDICAEFIARPEYSGGEFSYGDAQIAEKAANQGSCGNAETWRTIGVNHHVEMVLNQIASLP